ncbi:MAG TPA: hypothetical protein VHM02_14390, partial [Thermoanaerobaculia bacterium]|nr:hypothetical protein [Thermoanaerobaculia bacterium]
MRPLSRSLPFLLPILAAAVAPAALATSYVPVADADLAAKAEAIAVVRVIERLAPSPAGEEPSTRYRAAVEEAVSGRLDGEIVVRVPGGTSADGTGWDVAAAPRFGDGERALLFLVERGDGSWGIADLMLGAFHEVVRDGERLAVRDLADATRVGGASAAGSE